MRKRRLENVAFRFFSISIVVDVKAARDGRHDPKYVCLAESFGRDGVTCAIRSSSS